MPAVRATEVETIPKGIYLMNLTEIEVKASTLKRDDGGASADFWIWKFRGKCPKLKDGKTYKLEISTGSGVSKKDSALKSLLSTAFPDMTLEEMKSYNTDEMIGKTWTISVGVELKEDGTKKNKILDLEESDSDPFAND